MMKILVIKPSSLGDVIHALPFLQAVKDTFPYARVDWVISKNLRGILEGNPLINELIVFDKDSWKNIKNLPKTSRDISLLRKTLRNRRYDIVVDLQGLLRSGLMSLSTQSPLKVGFADAREGSRFFYNKKVTTDKVIHAVERNLKAARAIGAKVNKIAFPLKVDNIARERTKNLLGDIKGYIVISPSARWHTKRWPVENFASLISKLPITCIITGSKADREIANKITSLSTGKTINLCGKTNLKELVALMAGARAVVSNDSGPMHIAAALNIPVVALFGPTDPLKTGPYGWQSNKNFLVIREHVPCSPCFKKKCKEPVCMSNITVEKVFKELRKYL